MKEVIIIAGKNKFEVGWVRCCLKVQGYHSILCKTLKELIEELKILPVCSVHVSLVIIDSSMWKNINNDLISEIIECAPDVPFVLLDENNTIFSVEDWLAGPMRDIGTTGSKLLEHVFADKLKLPKGGYMSQWGSI